MVSILTRPVVSPGGIPGTALSNISVGPSATVTIDQVVGANTPSVKWMVTVIDTTNSKTVSYEINALNKFNSSISHNRFGVLGDNIDHTVNVQLSAGNINLNVTNNETTNIAVNVVRIQTTYP